MLVPHKAMRRAILCQILQCMEFSDAWGLQDPFLICSPLSHLFTCDVVSNAAT